MGEIRRFSSEEDPQKEGAVKRAEKQGEEGGERRRTRQENRRSRGEKTSEALA